MSPIGRRIALLFRARDPLRAAPMTVLCAGLLVGMCLGFTACARPAPAAQEAAHENAGRLFERACARCHAADGSGGLPMAAGGPRPIDLRHAEWQASRSDEEIAAAIRDGRGAMPPFSDVLSPAEVAALAGYVRQIGRSSPD